MSDIDNKGRKELINKLINSDNEILIITPSYPSEENKYFGGFVHCRVKAYHDAGIKFDLICVYDYAMSYEYVFEEINVVKTNYIGLRDLLQYKNYKKIFVHFFDEYYSNIFDSCLLQSTKLYLWIHGPETLYWEWSKMTDNYFVKESKLTQQQIERFEFLDKIIKRYNENTNVKWVFVSNWIKNKSEQLIGIKFNNYCVIPNYIDEKTFSYSEKSDSLRKKIFVLRRFENINKYAIDIDVRTIIELSKRECFDDLEFSIYGTGAFRDTLLKPIKDFKNVKLYSHFLSHEEIADVHKKNGIGLFATRYDAQGVSMCEAASSGLAIVSSDNDAIKEFIPNECKNLCETEDYESYADVIEELYYKPNLFQSLRKACHDKVNELCSFSNTIKKEIELLKEKVETKPIYSTNKNISKNPVLTVIIPAYNVSQYLYHCVESLLRCKNSNLIEVIIVNDGSTDNTLEIANSIKNDHKKSNIIIIDKENGGHGSTINAGLKIASGKYVRVLDGDDWVNFEELDLLLNVLEDENADVVITDYSEDHTTLKNLVKMELYNNLIEGKLYKFDDLCYEGYGFNSYGPILATANIRTNLIKDNMRLTEKSFYVDMEFDAYMLQFIDTIKYYPFDIYRYYIGREGQSISEDAYKKRYKQHENIVFNLIGFIENGSLSENKKRYIKNKLIFPMIQSQNIILREYIQSKKETKEFNQKLAKHGSEYVKIVHDQNQTKSNESLVFKIFHNRLLFNKFTVGAIRKMKEKNSLLYRVYISLKRKGF